MAVCSGCLLNVHKYSINKVVEGTRKINRVISAIKVSVRNSSASANKKEYTDVPEYPPIIDTSRKGVNARAKEEWHNKIKSIQTVEEKLFAINLPKYYGWTSFMFTEGVLPYNILPLSQFITRTHVVAGGTLPECYGPGRTDPNQEVVGEDLCSRLLKEIKPQIEEALVLEYSLRRKHHYSSLEKGNNLSSAELENILGTSIIHQVNRILLANLSATECPHLIKTEVDLHPRLEAFWATGGIDPPTVIRKSKENNDSAKDEANKPVDRWVQYLGSPVLQVRSEEPLPQYVPLQEYGDSELSVPIFTYDPRVLGVQQDTRHGTNIPGFWPGDVCEFGLVSYHNRGHLLDRPPHYGEKDRQESLLAQAILASYSWTFSQACYQGFSTYNELTYPLVTQTVITNGQLWSFFSYQLNTTLLHSEHSVSNSRRNICWATNELKLFESISNGKINGFNDDVLKTLIKFYINKPKIREGIDMKPYLNHQDGPHIADIADSERRTWLESQFKHMYSNRPRERLPYEIYDWERIYKISNNTRPLEKKTRPFALGENPLRKKYYEHQPAYIPKKLRPEDKKNKNKWSKTYYPV